MPILVTPEGDREDVPQETVDRARQEFGYVTPDEWAAKQQNPVAGAAEGALQGVARAAMAPGLAIQKAVTGSAPGVEAGREQSALSEGVFSPQALARKEEHPTAAMVGEGLPIGIAGALSGGAGAGLAGAAGLAPAAGAAAGLGLESLAAGASQEAVDAVTQNRDFSAKAMLMNGGVNLAFGGLLLGAGKLLEAGAARGLGRAAEGEAGAAGGLPGGPEAPPRGRDWVKELDPGEVPEAVPGGSGRKAGAQQAESAGAAAHNFDDLDADKAIQEIQSGKDVDVGKLAGAAPAIREHLASEGARSLDTIQDILSDEGSIGVKHDDFRAGAAERTPETLKAQRAFVNDATDRALQLGDALAKEPHAGGLGEAARAEIQKGVDRVTAATDLAERNVALDNFKRSMDGLANRVAHGRTGAADELTRQAMADRIVELSDHLRDGLANPEYFGRNAELQAAQNAAYVDLIKPLGVIEPQLYRQAERRFATAGRAGRQLEADPEKLLSLLNHPRGGGELFQKNLGNALDAMNKLASVRQELGLSKLDRLAELTDHLQQFRDDLNTNEVLHAAERRAGSGGHGTGGASVGSALAANVVLHAAEAGGRAAGFAFGNAARQMGALGKIARGFDKAKEAFGFSTEMAGEGTATRRLLDRYAERVKGSSLVTDSGARDRMSDALRDFLDAAHAPKSVPRPPTPPAAGGTPPAPGGAANDVSREAAGMAAAPPKLEPKLQSAFDALSRSKEPMTKGQLGEVLRGRGTAEWEIEELQRKGLVRAIPPEEHAKHPGWSVEMRYEPVPQPPSGAGGAGKAAAALGVAGGAGALLASGNAGAAELLPEQRQNRDAFAQKLSETPPEYQGQQLQTAESLARITQRVNQRVEGAVSDLFALAHDPDAPPRFRSPKARQIDKKAQELDVPRHLARFMGKHDDPVDAFNAKAGLIHKLAQDPAALSRHMAMNLGDLPSHDPEIFAAMVGQTMNAVNYLAETMPGNSGQNAFDPKGYPPTFEEISEWAGRCVGAEHPLDSLDDLASNDLVPEQMEAVQTLWPEGYQLFQTAAMRQIHELSQKKGGISLAALEQIDSALDLDGAGEPVLSSAMATLIRQAEAQDEQQKQAEAPKQLPPMQSQSPQRLASSSLGSLHGATS